MTFQASDALLARLSSLMIHFAIFIPWAWATFGAWDAGWKFTALFLSFLGLTLRIRIRSNDGEWV